MFNLGGVAGCGCSQHNHTGHINRTRKRPKKNPPEQSNGGSLCPLLWADPSGLKRTGFSQTYAAGLSPSLGAAAPPVAASSDTTAAGMVAEAITGFSASR